MHETLDKKSQALRYHRDPVPGKFKTVPTKPMETSEDLTLAYSPGVAEACKAIVENPICVADYTIRGQLVAVISNGTAVLGLGDIGPLASKPVMEGKAILFQKFAHLQAIDLEIAETDPEKLIDIIAALEPSFGAINLEDIKAPECFRVEEGLQSRLNIPVFHDDQHGTAITVSACLLNALQLVGKSISDVRCVVLGAGASALACVNFLVKLGLKKENAVVCDRQGVIRSDRPDLSIYKAKVAQSLPMYTLQEALADADIFLGLSGPGLVTKEMILGMHKKPIVFALSNPTPEIFPHHVYEVHKDAIVGTGRSDMPNQVNNLLCFPFIFKGALDAKASKINHEMMVACVDALQSIAQQGFSDVLGHYDGQQMEFGQSYFIPKPFDPRLLTELPFAVAEAAVHSGVASPFDLMAYKKKLIKQAYASLPVFCLALIQQVERLEAMPELCYEGVSPEILSVARTLQRYGLARPAFMGNMDTLSDMVQQHPVFMGCRLLSVSEAPMWTIKASLMLSGRELLEYAASMLLKQQGTFEEDSLPRAGG
jgi:malate dehydrogenase (oxaloacetate-decarboxylating)(NADP+)